MTNDHLHIIYHRGYQNIYFFAFQASPKSSSECSRANKDDLKENLGKKEERFWSDARALHPDAHADAA